VYSIGMTNQPLLFFNEASEHPLDKSALMTKLVFYAPEAKASDVMLVFGAPEGDWSIAAKAYHDGLTKLIVTSGGIHERTNGIPEAILIRDELISQGVPSDAIIADTSPTNTLENVLGFKRILKEHGLLCSRILYLTIHHHSGRCYLTIKKYFPDAKITALGHGLLFSGLDIQKDTWTTIEGAEKRVYGEYQRILTYSDKGDIADPREILDVS
jgi:uncharacterized SAM-binding protein YcdF (DUF218 family)